MTDTPLQHLRSLVDAPPTRVYDAAVEATHRVVQGVPDWVVVVAVNAALSALADALGSDE